MRFQFVVIVIASMVATFASYTLAVDGEPSSHWYWCHVLQLCKE